MHRSRLNRPTLSIPDHTTKASRIYSQTPYYEHQVVKYVSQEKVGITVEGCQASPAGHHRPYFRPHPLLVQLSLRRSCSSAALRESLRAAAEHVSLVPLARGRLEVNGGRTA